MSHRNDHKGVLAGVDGFMVTAAYPLITW
jgi:hypothetical protein